MLNWDPVQFNSRPSRPSRLCRRLQGGRAALLALALIAALAPACASSRALAPSDAAPLDHLLTLIAERLAVAPDVARAKWNSHAAIEDLPREQQVIDAVGDSAARYGVPRAEAEWFFRAQIEASKIVQRTMTGQFAEQRRPPFPTVVSLDTIRPTLDRLTPEMLEALGSALRLMDRPEMRRTVGRRSRTLAPKVPGGDEAMAAAVAPLFKSRD